MPDNRGNRILALMPGWILDRAQELTQAADKVDRDAYKAPILAAGCERVSAAYRRAAEVLRAEAERLASDIVDDRPERFCGCGMRLHLGEGCDECGAPPRG